MPLAAGQSQLVLLCLQKPSSFHCLSRGQTMVAPSTRSGAESGSGFLSLVPTELHLVCLQNTCPFLSTELGHSKGFCFPHWLSPPAT